MPGKCKYCGDKLKDEANIRCDKCDKIFQEGVDLGKDMIRDKVRETMLTLLGMSGISV